MVSVSAVSQSAEPATRPMVRALFVSTILLSIVSWYTTWMGMCLYLNGWFAFLASVGVQSALVLVAWLIGFTDSRRALLTSAYAITAVVSVAFSYVSLYTWFSAKERPALVQRQLYDTILASTGDSEQQLAAAIAEARKHVTALDEMAAAEKMHGFIARAQDADPYLAQVREAVAREAQSLGNAYREGSGEGVRYTAFERYAKLARQSYEQLAASQEALKAFRSQLKADQPSEAQIRRYREVIDAIPWVEAERHLHGVKLTRPEAPALSSFLDKTSSGQEELLLAFTELVAAPTGRHVFAFLLAAFIDVIVFLLAFACGPYFHGTPMQRWPAASASIDGVEPQIFIRDFLRKLDAGQAGLARVAQSKLSAGERQFCLLLASRGLASTVSEDGEPYYMLDDRIHQQLVESLTVRTLPIKVSGVAASSPAS